MKKSIEGAIVKFEFEGLEPLSFDVNSMSEETQNYAIPFGMCHRLGDMAAIPKSDGKGNVIVVTEQMRRDAVEAGIKHYSSGTKEWNMKGTRVAPQNPTILAIAAKMGISYTEAEAEIQRRMLAELEG